VLAATIGLTFFLQDQGIELSSKDFVFHLPPRRLPTFAVTDGDGRDIRGLDDPISPNVSATAVSKALGWPVA
jgi:hypothetical protein